MSLAVAFTSDETFLFYNTLVQIKKFEKIKIFLIYISKLPIDRWETLGDIPYSGSTECMNILYARGSLVGILYL